MLVARKFPDVEARLAKLRALSLDVPELTRGSVQLALTTSNLTYPILAFEDDPEEREPRPVIRQATLQGYSGPSLSRGQITRLLDLRSFPANGPERAFRLDLIGAESHFGRARSGPPGSGAQIQQCRIAIDEYTKLLPESFVDNLTKEPFTIPTLDPGPLFGYPPMFAHHKFLLIRLASACLALGDALFRRSFRFSAEARAEIAKQYVIAIRLVVRSKLPLDNDLRRDIKSYALQQHANPPSTRLVPIEAELEQAIADLESGKKSRVVVEGVVPLVLGENRLLFSSEPEQTIPEDDALFDLLPIENYGLTGTWRLQIDDGDLRNVTDVVLHFLVSVPQSPEPLEEHIRNLIDSYEVELAKGGALDRMLTVPLRRRFPDTFDELEVGPGSFTLREQDFPDDITDLRVKAIVAQAVDGDGKGVSGIGLEISKPGTPVSLTRTTGADGFSEDLDAEIPPIPEADRPDIEGDWQVRLLDPGHFSSLDDLLLFFVYTFSVVPLAGDERGAGEGDGS